MGHVVRNCMIGNVVSRTNLAEWEEESSKNFFTLQPAGFQSCNIIARYGPK